MSHMKWMRLCTEAWRGEGGHLLRPELMSRVARHIRAHQGVCHWTTYRLSVCVCVRQPGCAHFRCSDRVLHTLCINKGKDILHFLNILYAAAVAAKYIICICATRKRMRVFVLRSWGFWMSRKSTWTEWAKQQDSEKLKHWLKWPSVVL